MRRWFAAGVLVLAACGGNDRGDRVERLEQRVETEAERRDRAEAAEDLDAYIDCYNDPGTERWVPNLPVPAPGECPT